MSDITQSISFIEEDEPQAARFLLPLVDDKLRMLAARRLAREKPGQTLQPTALVNEEVVELRQFAGLGREQAAAVLSITVYAARQK